MLAAQKEELTVRSLYSLFDSVTCESEPHNYKCDSTDTKPYDWSEAYTCGLSVNLFNKVD